MMHTWHVVADSDLSKWFFRHLQSECELIRQELFYSDDPVMPPNEPLYPVLFIELCCARARELGVPPSIVLRVVTRALGIPDPAEEFDATHATPPSTVVGFLDRLRKQHATAAPFPTSVPTVPAEPSSAAPPERIRIVRAGDVAARAMKLLSEFEPLKDDFDALDPDDVQKLFETLSTGIAEMIQAGLQ